MVRPYRRILNFKCLHYDISCKFDDSLDVKLHKSQSECSAAKRTRENRRRQDTKLKFRRSVPPLLYSVETNFLLRVRCYSKLKKYRDGAEWTLRSSLFWDFTQRKSIFCYRQLSRKVCSHGLSLLQVLRLQFYMYFSWRPCVLSTPTIFFFFLI
jgi:hypothetical protein